MQGALLITNENTNKINDLVYWQPKAKETLESIKQYQESLSESITEKLSLFDKSLNKITTSNYDEKFFNLQEAICQLEEDTKLTEAIEELKEKISSIEKEFQSTV